jgi:hypothetical protein
MNLKVNFNKVVKILTKKITPALNVLISDFNIQYSNTLEVRTTSAFHDRFIIVDKTEIFHFGASLKDAGSRGFMYSLIEEESLTNSILRAFESEWLNNNI